MLKKFVAVVLALSLSWLMPLAISIAEAGTRSHELMRYTHIAEISGSFDIESGIAECYGTGRSRYDDTTTTVKVTLQKRTIGTSQWSAVCSWSDTQSGRTVACVDEERSVSKGYDYRIYVKCTIKNSEGSVLETSGLYSRIISYS